MIALAIECSSGRASLALFGDGGLLAVGRVAEGARRMAPLFEALDRLLKSAGAHPRDLDPLIVGRGPGNYAGLRAALTLARFFALPDGRTVYALSSGAALAAAVLRETGAPAVATIGDARRGHCWWNVFRPGDGGIPRADGDWGVAPPDALAARLPPEALRVSPEYERLRAQGVTERLGAGRWIEGDRPPDAAELGALALRLRRAGVPTEPPAPLYLHPAVGGGTAG